MKTLAIIVLALTSLSLSARDHISFGIEISPRPTPFCPPPAPVYPYYTNGGHYETRYEQVLVCPERYETVYVQGYDEVVTDRNGNPIVIKHPGYYRSVLIPARYETRAVTVYVPDCRPTFSIGFGYRR